MVETHRRTRGFTLIELLIVIAIIAILAAILFPVFMVARSKARQIACVSNMSQISKAAIMYADDHEGHFPLHESWYQYPRGNIPGTRGVCYHNLLMPYVKNDRVFLCKERPKHTVCCGIDSGSTGTNLIWKTGITSYAVWVNFDGWLVQTKIKNPSKYAYLFEASFDWIDYAGQLMPYRPEVGPFDHIQRLHLWHMGGINVAYADGHVSYYRSNDIPNDVSWWNPWVP